MFEAAGSGHRLFVGTVYDWVPDPGRIVSWQASPASLEKARKAPLSDVPLGAMQEAHLRGFSRYAARGLDYARLVIGCWRRTRSVRCPCHELRHQFAPSSA